MVIFPYIGYKNAKDVAGKLDLIMYLTIGYYFSVALYMFYERCFEKYSFYNGYNDVVIQLLGIR